MCDYEFGHSYPSKDEDVRLIAEDVTLCFECALLFLTWQADNCPDPAEFPEFAEWAGVVAPQVPLSLKEVKPNE